MQIGISTANFYPLPIEDALSSLQGLGAQTTEIFINTRSELDPAFIAMMRDRAATAGVSVRALHSYTSCFEPYLLFSRYERRFADGLDVFRPLYKAAVDIGANYLILHGDQANGALSDEESIARFEQLYDLGQEYGVTLLQENVVRFRASSPTFVRAMRRQLGDKAQFTLDLKQCRRTGIDAADMIDAMAGAIRHVHISDGDSEHDCLMPGQGREDFPALLKQLKATGFDGALIIELYRRNYDTIADFSAGVDTLRRAIAAID